jgi:hypothetical protein
MGRSAIGPSQAGRSVTWSRLLPRVRLALIALALFLFVGTIGGELARSMAPTPTRFELAAEALSAPGIGRGGDVLLPRGTAIAHPVAVALYASAESLHFLRTRSSDSRDRAIAAADRLLDLAVADGSYGWGLGFAWDPSNDGSTNPPETVYGITTALSVRALLDVYAIDSDPRFLQSARRALDAYRSFFSSDGVSRGYFWSSDRSGDDDPVISVSAQLAGQYARAADIVDDSQYAALARSAAEWILAHARHSGDAVMWPFRVSGVDPNDAVNAAYIVDGLLQVEHHIGLAELDRDGALRWLRRFVVSPTLSTRYVGDSAPDRSWGVAYLLYDFCTYTDDGETIARLRSVLDTYEYAPGRYGPHPGVEVFYPRFQAHVLLALAACPSTPS